jgi:hypothetical protein
MRFRAGYSLAIQEIAMNYQNPPLMGQAKNATYDYDRAAEKDARLQAELAPSVGRATLPVVAVYFTAMVFIVCIVLYGLNSQRDETVTNASAPAAEAPANNAGDAPQQQGNAPAGQQQGQQPPAQNSAQPAQQQQPAQPQQNSQQPAAPQNQPANAQQQLQPTQKQQ